MLQVTALQQRILVAELEIVKTLDIYLSFSNFPKQKKEEEMLAAILLTARGGNTGKVWNS